MAGVDAAEDVRGSGLGALVVVPASAGTFCSRPLPCQDSTPPGRARQCRIGGRPGQSHLMLRDRSALDYLGRKHQIRSSKYETNSKSQTSMSQTSPRISLGPPRRIGAPFGDDVWSIGPFGFRNCLAFRDSCLGPACRRADLVLSGMKCPDVLRGRHRDRGREPGQPGVVLIVWPCAVLVMFLLGLARSLRHLAPFWRCFGAVLLVGSGGLVANWRLEVSAKRG